MSAVEVTKSLRDRGKPLSSRIKISKDILEGRSAAIIPRKEIVILDWILDMLAIDNEAKSSDDAWDLLQELWPATPQEGRVRAFKNHKFVAIVIDALKVVVSSDLVEKIVQCSSIISESINEPLFQFSSDQQASQLLLSYCSNSVAVNNESMSTLIFDSLKTRPHIFSKSQDDTTILDYLIAENHDERRIHYLKDFVSWPSHPVVPSKTFRIDSIIMATCEIEKQSQNATKQHHDNDTNGSTPVKDNQGSNVDMNHASEILSKRILEIAKAFPHAISEEIDIVSRTHPSVLKSHLLQDLLLISTSANNDSPYWSVVNSCLLLNPAALVDYDEMMNKILASPTIPQDSLASLIAKMSDLRKITDLFDKWLPNSSSLPDIVEQALMKAFDKLSALQIVHILDSKSPTKELENDKVLSVIVKSLSYRSAALQPVATKLDDLFHSENTTDELKAEILNIHPHISIKKPNKKDNTFVLLRSVELGHAKDPEALVSSAAKRLDKDENTNNSVLLRYFPLIEKFLDESKIKKIIKRTSQITRNELVSNHDFLECSKLTNAILEFSIEHSEMDVLNLVPKEVFSWDLRHKVVEKMLTEKYSFERVAPFINRIVDSQNPPSAKLIIKGLLKEAKPINTSLLLDFFMALKPSYLRELLTYSDKIADWQTCCIECVLAKKENNSELAKNCIAWIRDNFSNKEFVDGIILILSLIPNVPQVALITKEIAQEYIGESSMELPRPLFTLMCHQKYDWSIITAFFVFTGCAFEEEYIDYLKTLQSEEITQLFYISAEESQYGVLKALIISRLINENQQMINVVTFCVLKAAAVLGITEKAAYWEFCDALLREQPSLVTQFTLETVLGLIASSTKAKASAEVTENDSFIWERKALVTSRIFLLKRSALKKRLHLAINSLSSLLLTIHHPQQALLFYRLVDNLCNPPQFNYKSRSAHQELTSQVAKERRHVSRYIGVLLQNIILTVISRSNTSNSWSESDVHLRAACLLIIDLIYGDGLKAVSAGMDSASRAYLKSLFEYYKLHGRWSSDD